MAALTVDKRKGRWYGSSCCPGMNTPKTRNKSLFSEFPNNYLLCFINLFIISKLLLTSSLLSAILDYHLTPSNPLLNNTLPRHLLPLYK